MSEQKSADLSLFFNYFIYLFLVVLGFFCRTGFSLVAVSGGCSLVVVCGLPLVGEHGHPRGCAGLAIPQHVGSCQTRSQTSVPCIGRWIRKQLTTRDVPSITLLMNISWNQLGIDTFLFTFLLTFIVNNIIICVGYVLFFLKYIITRTNS